MKKLWGEVGLEVRVRVEGAVAAYGYRWEGGAFTQQSLHVQGESLSTW